MAQPVRSESDSLEAGGSPLEGTGPSSGQTASASSEFEERIGVLMRGAGAGLTGRLGGRLLTLVSQILLARGLGPGTYGLYATGLNLLRVSGLLIPLGMDKAVVRFGSLERGRPQGTAFRRSLVAPILAATLLGLVAGVALFLSAPWIATRLFGKADMTSVLRWFAPAIMAYAGMRVAASATSVSQRLTYRLASEDLLQPALELGLIGLSFGLGLGVFGAIGATLISTGVALLLAIVYLLRLYPGLLRIPWRRLMPPAELVRFALTTTGSSVFATFIVWIDRLMVARYLPAPAVGIYQTASQTSLLFAIILAGFNAILMPMVADLEGQGRRDQLEQIYRVGTKWALYLSLPLFLVLMTNAGVVIRLLYGGEYAPAADPLRLLVVGQLVNVATGAVGILLMMMGLPAVWTAITGVVFGLSVVALELVIPRYGLMGAAAVTTAGLSAQALAGLALVRSRLKLWPYDRRYLKGIAGAAVAALAIVGASAFSYSSLYLRLLVVTGLGLGAFGLTLALLGLEAEDRAFWRWLTSLGGNGRQ